MLKHIDDVQVFLNEIGRSTTVRLEEDTRYAIVMLIEDCKTLYNRYLPVKAGDTVKLMLPINFENAHGWLGDKDWLKPGVTGKVDYVRFTNDGELSCDVCWWNPIKQEMNKTIHSSHRFNTLIVVEPL